MIKQDILQDIFTIIKKRITWNKKKVDKFREAIRTHGVLNPKDLHRNSHALVAIWEDYRLLEIIRQSHKEKHGKTV